MEADIQLWITLILILSLIAWFSTHYYANFQNKKKKKMEMLQNSHSEYPPQIFTLGRCGKVGIWITNKCE